jgi:hypothetical protein
MGLMVWKRPGQSGGLSRGSTETAAVCGRDPRSRSAAEPSVIAPVTRVSTATRRGQREASPRRCGHGLVYHTAGISLQACAI